MPGAVSPENISLSVTAVHLESMEGFGHDDVLGLASDPYNRAQPAVRPFNDTQFSLVQVLR